MSRHARRLFWIVVLAILALGLERILADPTRSSPSPGSPVIITEFAASNGAGLTDEDGDYSDWIELYNRSASDINLEGWSLSDDPSQPRKWTFRPLRLKSGDYLVVFASGKNRRRVRPEEGRPSAHTSFRLNGSGGYLGLFSPTSRRYLDASEFTYPVQFPDISYGVEESGDGPRFFDNPTPGDSNDASTAWMGVLTPVSFSEPHGVNLEPLTVALSHADSDAEIWYTTDGSEPAPDNGTLYLDAIVVSETVPIRAAAFKRGFRRSPVATQTYILGDDVLTQPENPSGAPSTWGTHTIDLGGYEAGAFRLADYALDGEIVDDPEYGPLLPQALQSLPSLSLVMDPTSFETLYANPRERGVEAERAASVELIYPDDSDDGFQVDAGIRIQGGAGRWEFIPKHSFRLFFKQRYGASELDFPLFPGSPVTEFDTLVLRAGVDRSYAGHPSTPDLPVNHRDTVYARDEWTRSSQITASGVGSRGLFVHLYINGLYWGLYNVVERPDASFAAANLGGDKESWFTANHGGAVGGQPDRFQVMVQLAQEGGLDDPEKYATMLEFVNPVQFSDYLIVNWYAGNRDWPENNWYVDVQNPAGRNQFFVWDAEGTWDEGAKIILGTNGFEGAPYPNVVKLVFEAMLANPDFRMTLADRLYRHLYHDGSLTDANAQDRWVAITDGVERAIVAESARWGDVRYDDPITPDDWRRARDKVLFQMEGNAEKLVKLARDAGYYPRIDPPKFSQQGGDFERELALQMRASTGLIYYTTDGSDPRSAVSGVPSDSAMLYAEPIVLSTATTVQARVLDGTEWSALNEAHFRHPYQRSDVRITELMYNPIGDEEAEYLELRNFGDVPADLSGAHFDGIEYRFPDGALLGPGEYWVLIRDLKKFRRRYPEAEVYGIYDGKLSDRGEAITVYSRDGSVLFHVPYGDGNGWPLSADGSGDSIVLLDDATEPALPGSWRASESVHGSPGSGEGAS